MTAAKDNSVKLQQSSRQAVVFLAIQFLLGMATNLVGETEGGSMMFTNIFLVLHALNAVILVAGALMTIPIAAKVNSKFGRLARQGGGIVIGTFIAGVLTFYTHNNWWSFVMATGFIVSLLLYSNLWARARA